MAQSCGDPLGHLGQNSSFWQRRVYGFDSAAWVSFEFEMSREEESE
jgi:hypothetical protein